MGHLSGAARAAGSYCWLVWARKAQYLSTVTANVTVMNERGVRTMAVLKMPAAGTYTCTPAELFGLDSSPEVLQAWNKAIDDIEASERAAAADDASICIH